MEHWSVNEAAACIIEEEILPKANRLNIEVVRLKNGAVVLDMGIRCKGGFRAGKYFAEVGMGGLGRLSFTMIQLERCLVPGLRVFTENPGVCEMASYVAATKVPWKGDLQVISGPVRSIRGSDHFAQLVSYRDPTPQKAVAGVQTTEMPDEELAEGIAQACGISPNRLYIMAARTGCMVGAVQVCARNVEQAMPTVADRGFSMSQILEGNATTPLVSVVDDEAVAYGRVNDCLIYGQETNLTVRCADEAISAMLADIPFSKNQDVYGIPFQELFARCKNNWAYVPRDWDAPCKINFFNITTGNRFTTGRIGYETLEKAFLGDGGTL
ncbi:methenyltetrahydromethanopterin cyclohydrolase [uncultured Oscillibacter sp.]|uniref:methenyltetrahydromethanopterin cyclohydrolase n=1 Tax=uncultured Oscillibacter sp. TaxID=876091 RepID=UPI00262B136C|nr:methenyltetrahydromethanopterin cyclohydrolase [uncultured Oscillibacter sp.]